MKIAELPMPHPQQSIQRVENILGVKLSPRPPAGWQADRLADLNGSYPVLVNQSGVIGFKMLQVEALTDWRTGEASTERPMAGDLALMPISGFTATYDTYSRRDVVARFSPRNDMIFVGGTVSRWASPGDPGAFEPVWVEVGDTFSQRSRVEPYIVPTERLNDWLHRSQAIYPKLRAIEERVFKETVVSERQFEML